MHDHLDQHLQDPLDRALAGLGAPPPDDGCLRTAVLAAQARTDGGLLLTAAEAEALEARATEDPQWWVPAARLHATASPERRRQARSALARQALPYVYPGEIHPLMVHLLAAGDRVLPALHIDWTRKLTKWVSALIAMDLAHLGLWFWPILDSMASDSMARPMTRLAKRGRGPAGAMGLAVAYCHNIGIPGDLLLEQCGPEDRLLSALAWESTSATKRSA